MPTDGVEILFAHPGTKAGYQDYNNIEYPVYISALDAAGVTYDIYNWAEYERYALPETYKSIFTYANSAGADAETDAIFLCVIIEYV